MKLQYLGTAAAEGVPSLFCRCEVCKNARARGGREIRSRSQAIVNDRLLIDFPSDSFYHCTQFGIDLSQLESCIITHIHGDHTFPWEFHHIRRGNSVLPADYRGFHLYGSEDIEGRFADPVKNANGRLHLHVVSPFEPFLLEGMRITALKAKHGTAHPYVYMIEDGERALLYAHDTEMLPEETWEYLQRVGVKFDLVSLDCTGGAAEKIEKYSHMYLGINQKCRERMLDMGLADSKTIFVLNHFSHNGLSANYQELCQIVTPLGFDVSYDGKIITV
ncbi:MAG: hypothetical protein J6B71_10110 [Clostridia bacterium]|nr:hypothetical protein [Clostridia bacterium]